MKCWRAAFVVIVICLVPRSSAVRADDNAPFTIHDALHEALRASPDVRAAQARAEAARARKDAARAVLRPVLAGVGGMEHELTKDRGISLKQSSTGKLGLSLSQALLDFQAPARVREAGFTAESAYWESVGAEQAFIAAVAEAYVAMRESRELEKLAKGNHDLSVKHFDSTRQRFYAGELTRTDMARAEARAEAARAAWLGARATVVRGTVRFTETVGMPPPEVMMPVSVCADASVTVDTCTPLVMSRPDIRAATLRVEAALQGVVVEKGARIPRLSLVGQVGNDWGGANSWSVPTTYGRLGVNMTVPIYSSGGIGANMRGAEALAREQEQNLERLRRRALGEATQEIMAFGDLLDTVDAQRKAAKAAEDALAFVTEEFSAGSRTALDYLDAQEDLFNTKTGLARSTHAATRAKIKLQLAIGTLSMDCLGATNGQ